VRNADRDAINSSGSRRIWAMKGVKTKLPGTKDFDYYILLSLAITVVILGTVVFHLLEKWRAFFWLFLIKCWKDVLNDVKSD
jgi:hypothetical protein